MVGRQNLFWDNHTYVTPTPGTHTIEELIRHKNAGFDVAFLNLGDADKSLEDIIRMAAFFRCWLRENSDQFVLLKTIADIDQAKKDGKLAIGFNIEGCFSVGEQVEVVEVFYELGVRWMAFVYNRRNLMGSGVHDDVDNGLTKLGYKLAAEMDRVGIIKCCSHTGYRTAMDVLTNSDLPCIFSHSNALALKKHARNIPDELIRACADTGGVIGVNGINIFLGAGADQPALMADHIDYIAQLVGIDHVGLGFDSGYMDIKELNAAIAQDTSFWPKGNEYDGHIDCVPIEGIGDIINALEKKGYSNDDIAKVTGNNMKRVAQAVWR